MGQYRNISLNFWTDSKVDDDFTPEDKYFYLYLITNPHTNICGCYEISIKQMARETGYNEDTILRLLKRMSDVHKVLGYDSETKEVLMFNWHKYNWSSSEKLIKAVNRVAMHIKNNAFREYILSKINDGVDNRIQITVHSTQITDTDNSTQYTVHSTQITDTDTDVCIPYGYGIDMVSEVEINKSPKPIRHKYGEYQNVLLTDEDYAKLQAEYPADYLERIERLSSYIASTGKSYKNHLATIRNWARKETVKCKPVGSEIQANGHTARINEVDSWV